MRIDINILIAWGGVAKKYHKNELIFYEGDEASHYYQILEGCVKMFNTNSEGKEFTQGIFHEGDTFGEPPLFIGECYPANAISIKDSVIIKLKKESFFKILDEYPDIKNSLIQLLARRIYNKSVTASEIINNNPEHRLLSFLNTYKKKINGTDSMKLIPYTRQEIANMTGLRVETVIRTLSKMKDQKKVKIVNRKLYY